MKVVCAWCRKVIEERDEQEMGQVAYSSCKECSAETEVSKQELLKTD
jgi:hypothetical protein